MRQAEGIRSLYRNTLLAPSDAIAYQSPSPNELGPERASSYIIYVRIPGDPFHVLLVHGYTGACDRVYVSIVRKLISLSPRPCGLRGADGLCGETTATPAPFPLRTQELLRQRGYLTRLTPVQEEDFFASIVANLHRRHMDQGPSFVLVPTFACNLDCKYCFQRPVRAGQYGRRPDTVMTRPMVDAIWRAMEDIEHQHGFKQEDRPQRDITFYGGEPLLARNLPVVAHAMRKATETGGASFGAITNATELNAYRDLLGPRGMAPIPRPENSREHPTDRAAIP